MLKDLPAERLFLSGKACAGFFGYFTMCFGVGAGPFVWGRVAAFVMRATRGMLGDTSDTHCFVDDPIIALLGTQAQRHWKTKKALLFWLCLGVQLSWKKG